MVYGTDHRAGGRQAVGEGDATLSVLPNMAEMREEWCICHIVTCANAKCSKVVHRRITGSHAIVSHAITHIDIYTE